MYLPRVCFPALIVCLGAWLPLGAQSVVSTRAGLIHYFEGEVSVGGTPLQPQFGRFPEIPEGSELTTAAGRAEVLLGPGVILRVAENSSLKMLSSSLADTRLEMVAGTAILESKAGLPGNSVTILYKDWQMHVAKLGVYRIDCNPEQLRVYNGEVQVQSAQHDPVTVTAGQTLRLTALLVPGETLGAPGDEFNGWAFDRSEAITADNATAANITDDPALYPDLGDPASGLAMPGYTYFPPVTGYPYLSYGTYGSYGAITAYPGSYYAPGGFRVSPYGSRTGTIIYRPSGGGGVTLPPLRLHYPIGVGGGTYRPPAGITVPRPVTPTMPHPAPVMPHPVHH